MKYFKEFDENVLKPILIYKYSKERKEKQFELFDVMKTKGQNIEQMYINPDGPVEENKDAENSIMDAIRKNHS